MNIKKNIENVNTGNSKISIEVKNVTMEFRMNLQKISSIKEYFIKRIKKQVKIKTFKALNNISFTVKHGEVIGIIGLNGAGKSTLLKVIAGVMKPTLGSIIVNGRISPLLELGTGFDNELTGRQNIYLNAAMLGFGKEYIEEKEAEIEDFAELGDFLDVPVKNYSSGMRARLGFSIATTMQPDILIVDEVLGVGDKNFKSKSQQRIKQLFAKGSTVLLVSHAIPVIREMCHRVIWLEKGEIKMIGETKPVCNVYINKKSM